MPLPQCLYATSGAESAARQWCEQLDSMGCTLPLRDGPVSVDARWLRQHPKLSLICDEQGLWLSGLGMRMQPDWAGELPRLRRATQKNELLARACQVEQKPLIVDGTAGLGHDGLLLAWLGARVRLIERQPVVVCLLSDALQQAMKHPELAGTCQRLSVTWSDSAEAFVAGCVNDSATGTGTATGSATDFVNGFDTSPQANSDTELSPQVDPAVIYLDPMFPPPANPRKKAQVKKQMQLLHALLDSPDAADSALHVNAEMRYTVALNKEREWLLKARTLAARVIVKRPRHAPYLGELLPDHQWLGDACRFDAYFNSARHVHAHTPADDEGQRGDSP